MEVPEVGEELVSIASSVSTVAVAVNGKRNCKAALKWALERFGPEGRHFFKLLHVRPKITMVPTESKQCLYIHPVEMFFCLCNERLLTLQLLILISYSIMIDSL